MTAPDVMTLWEEGWAPIPVGADKRALVRWKEFTTSRPTRDQVLSWQRALRPAIWAGITGAVSSRVSLDFDGPAGCSTMEQLRVAPQRRTPNGGYHADFVAPSWPVPTVNGRSKRSLGLEYPGLDVRGDGGYINLLGATDTGSYEWLVEDRRPQSLESLPEVVRSALGLLTPPGPVGPTIVDGSSRQPAIDVPEAKLADAQVGTAVEDIIVTLASRAVQQCGTGRNVAGFWLATQLRDHGLSMSDSWLGMRVFHAKVPQINAKGMAEPYTLEEARSSLEQAYSQPPRRPFLPTGHLPQVMVAGQLRDVVTDAADALVAANEPPRLFRRGTAVVRLLGDVDGRVRTEPLSPDAMRHELSQAADWVKPGRGDEPLPTFTPMEIARTVLATELNGLPPLRDVIEAPTLRPDGSVLDSPGYDEPTGLYLSPEPQLQVPVVPDNPTQEQVGAALQLLRGELLGEFKFADEASAANALALLLTATLRATVASTVPLAVIDAPVAGSGKTLLTNVVSLIATGRPANLTTPPDRNDEEFRKRVTSVLLEGHRLVVFDNVSAPVQSPVLAQVLTADVWHDRILGVSRTATLPQRATWAITGNNVELAGDLPRRCYVIRLDPRVPQPWLRRFNRVDLPGWVLERRGDLLAAVLLLGRAWFAAGRPPGDEDVLRWGSFNGWSTTMGGMLRHAGVNEFLGNRDAVLTRADRESAQWTALLEHLLATVGSQPVRATVLLEALDRAGDDLPPKAVTESLSAARSGAARAQRLARKLDEVADRRFTEDGLRIERCGIDTTSKSRMWAVRRGGLAADVVVAPSA